MSEEIIEKTRKAERNTSIDCLKGLCIIFIIITHYGWPDYVSGFSVNMRLHLGFPFWIGMAVPIFLFTSGYLYSNSFNKAGIDSLRKGYAPSNLIPKFVRFLIPLAIVCFAELLLAYFTNPSAFQLQFDLALISNGMGPGTYYIPLLCLFIFLIPIVYISVQKIGFYSVVICFILNAIYEAVSVLIGNKYFTILPIRFLFLISFGCWLSYSNNKELYPTKRHWAMSGIASLVGIAFTICTSYFKIDPIIINRSWVSVSYMACLYILPLMMAFIYNARLSFKPLALVGKASFNIFLMQMLYYKFFAYIIYTHFDSILPGVLISVILCSGIGILFYHVENPLTSRLIRKLRKTR